MVVVAVAVIDGSGILLLPVVSQVAPSLVAIIMIVSHRNRKPADDFTATVPAPDPQQAITGGTR